MQQWWGRAAAFTNNFVNPIGLDNLGWKYYILYCFWIALEGLVIYLIFPETSKGTLEELAFCMNPSPLPLRFFGLGFSF